MNKTEISNIYLVFPGLESRAVVSVPDLWSWIIFLTTGSQSKTRQYLAIFGSHSGIEHCTDRMTYIRLCQTNIVFVDVASWLLCLLFAASRTFLLQFEVYSKRYGLWVLYKLLVSNVALQHNEKYEIFNSLTFKLSKSANSLFSGSNQ